jgi:hypothetical protein
VPGAKIRFSNHTPCSFEHRVLHRCRFDSRIVQRERAKCKPNPMPSPGGPKSGGYPPVGPSRDRALDGRLRTRFATDRGKEAPFGQTRACTPPWRDGGGKNSRVFLDKSADARETEIMENRRSNLCFNPSFMARMSLPVRAAARLRCVHSPGRFFREEQHHGKPKIHIHPHP